MVRSFLRFIPVLPLLFASSWARACSSCGCMLNTDWGSQGYVADPGWRLDVRYDDLNQDELRTGTKKVDTGSIIYPTDREIQQGTHNHNLTIGVDYAPDKSWGVNLQIPLIDRPHTTIVEGDSDVSGSRTSHLGDARLTGRYQGFLPEKNLGVLTGFKFPTGPFHDVFRDGPEAGTPLDRGLQAGTGTTDLLLGLYDFRDLTPAWGAFAQISLQEPLNAREEFKPGATWILSTGLRYKATARVAPQLQVTLKTETKESGAQSDRENSGGTSVYVSPGVSVAAWKGLNVYGFFQLPVHQNLNGYQLTPKAVFSLGLRHAL